MKKILVLVVGIMFIASIAGATSVATRISGNTVEVFSGIKVVSFNTVTNRVIMMNIGNTDMEVDLRCYNTLDNKFGHATSDSCIVFLPAFGTITPNSVDIEFATRNLGFEVTSGSRTRSKVWYIVTAEVGDF